MSDDKSWIYFLVMIVLSIIGSINKSKKKNVAPSPSPREEDEDDFPTIFFPKNIDTEGPKPDVAVSPVMQSTVKFENREGGSALSQSQETPLKIIEAEESNRPVLDLENKDELKKAVIYSEIFNRKFF